MERHSVKGLVAVSGEWSCEMGLGPGKTKAGGVSWPYPESLHCPLRSHELHKWMIRSVEGKPLVYACITIIFLAFVFAGTG